MPVCAAEIAAAIPGRKLGPPLLLREIGAKGSSMNDFGLNDAASASGPTRRVLVLASASATGSRVLPAEDVDRAFGMPVGKLRQRAGIHSVAHADDDEDELELGLRAARLALQTSVCPPRELNWIIASSETHHVYPSLSARVHARLGMSQACGALDVGGACLGLLNAMAVAQALIASSGAGRILIVTADVHSRTLSPGRVAGEFGGLFGDGASAFVLYEASNGKHRGEYQLGEFFFGCVAQYADAISVADTRDGSLRVQFDGEALSRAAITRMERVLAEVEQRSGIARSEVGAFATHQPNPRLVTLLAKQFGVDRETFPAVSQKFGNLGSSTCGAVLDFALRRMGRLSGENRKPIFLTSLGPGLVFGGGWLSAVGHCPVP
jgi:3-oxoacyl-[acyl-carrier-protein] synthase III